MTRYVAKFNDQMHEILTAGDAYRFVIDRLGSVFNNGRRAFRLKIGPADGGASHRDEDGPWVDFLDGPVLQVDFDNEVGRCAVTWLPDEGAIGIEPGVPSCHTDLVVCDDPAETPMVIVAADRARVTPRAAVKALQEYILTGKRPTTLEWIDGFTDPFAGPDPGPWYVPHDHGDGLHYHSAREAGREDHAGVDTLTTRAEARCRWTDAMDQNLVRAPFTPEQVALVRLVEEQPWGVTPSGCPRDQQQMTFSEAGWRCPCGYTQDWVPAEVVDREYWQAVFPPEARDRLSNLMA